MQLCSVLTRSLLRPARLRFAASNGMAAAPSAAAARYVAASAAAPKAALLIIGDEILQASRRGAHAAVPPTAKCKAGAELDAQRTRAAM